MPGNGDNVSRKFCEMDAFFYSKRKKSLDFLNYHPIPWRDSISRLIAPVSSVAGGDFTIRPRRQEVFLAF
jgi:hypothetical protein